MDRSNFCGCKGIRTCIKCEAEYGYENKNTLEFTPDTYVYCPYCNLAWEGTDIYSYKSHPNHSGKSFSIDGIYVKENFLSDKESKELMKNLDNLPWEKSQSGRRKQNFGPKCNFKKNKIKLGNFVGFPLCTKFIQDRFNEISHLNNFQTIEQCTLEYNNINGSSIDMHIDDCWIWGERIVTVNIIGDSVLTLNYYKGPVNKYNLHSSAYSYNKKYPNENQINTETSSNIIIRIPMPSKSLIILNNEARYEWQHCVLRNDIKDRRVCIAYREFTKPYIDNEKTKEIFEKAKVYF